MRLPARAITGHLVWSRDGAVWAVYRVQAEPYAYLTHDDKLRYHDRLRGLFTVLPAESLLLSVCRRVDPGEVVEAMIAGVDLDACPAWREEATATLDALAAGELLERRHYLAVRLPASGSRQSLASLGSAGAAVAERFGLAALPPRAADVAARGAQAQLIERRLARLLALRPTPAGELRWLYARALRRGLAEPYLDESWTSPERRVGDAATARVAGPSLAALADAVVFEGGAAGDPDRPGHRRYLRVDTAQGTGYQAFLCLADLPREWLFPGGGEWFHQLDLVGFPVDWCARVHAVDNQLAQVKARRQARQLAGQYDEHDGDAAGAPQELTDAAAGVDAERAELAANRNEPELQAAVVLSAAADSLPELEARAAQLQSLFTAAEYGLARPTGGQAALLAGTLPGSATPQPARDYIQYLLPRDLASGLPFTGHDVGDPTGMLLGSSRDTGAAAPVLFDAAYGPAHDRSGSIGMTGNLGSGKSYCIKRIAHATLARGGHVVALDRTRRGEYVAFAAVAPGRSQVLRLAADSPVCLDPLRVFDGDDAVTAATGFLTLLTRVAPTELEGVAVAEAVQAAADRPDATLRAVIDELARLGRDDPDADKAHRKLRAAARNRLAGLAFADDGRDLAALDADYTVFHTPGLALPSREELLNAHLARQLLPEQVLSQALLYLVAQVMRQITWRDWSRFAAALLDEMWALTASLQGRQLILDLVRDGRKHNAAVWLLSQHADDLGDDQLAHLLGNRFVFRQDPGAIPAAARFLGAEHTDETAGLLEHAEAGQCLYRDGASRIGCIQIARAPAVLHAAFDTNPTAGHPHDDTAASQRAGDPLAMPTDPADAVVAFPAPRTGDDDEGSSQAVLA